MTAGHWAELLEFEVDLPLLELDAGQHASSELADEVEAWYRKGLPSEPLSAMADGALDWLSESMG